MYNLSKITEVPANRALVLFDGVCNLCNGAINFIIERDSDNKFLFASLQSDVGQRVLEAIGSSTNMFDSIILLEDGQIFTKSTAALRIASHLDGGWPLFKILLLIPTLLRDPAYEIIAKYRYRLFGKKETCRLPIPEERSRFIDS